MKLLIVVFIAFSMQCSLVCGGIEAVPLQTAEEVPVEPIIPETEVKQEIVQTTTESALPEKSANAQNIEETAPDASSGQINKLLDVESTSLAKETERESSTKVARSVSSQAMFSTAVAPHEINGKPALVQPYGSQCSCFCPTPPPPAPCPHSVSANSVPELKPIYSSTELPQKHASHFRTADDDDDDDDDKVDKEDKKKVEDSLTEEARDRSAYAEQPAYPAAYEAPQSYSQQLYPVAPAYAAPKPYYQAPSPSYAAPQQPSYAAPQPQSYVAPQPHSYVVPQPSYAAPQQLYYAPHQYTYPSTPPKASCGQNLLVGCAPSVQQVPCSAYNAPKAY